MLPFSALSPSTKSLSLIAVSVFVTLTPSVLISVSSSTVKSRLSGSLLFTIVAVFATLPSATSAASKVLMQYRTASPFSSSLPVAVLTIILSSVASASYSTETVLSIHVTMLSSTTLNFVPGSPSTMILYAMLSSSSSASSSADITILPPSGITKPGPPLNHRSNSVTSASDSATFLEPVSSSLSGSVNSRGAH